MKVFESWIRISLLLVFAVILTGNGGTLTAQGPAKPGYEMALKNLSWRAIGPAIMGGRIDDFAVVESNPDIVYVGVASGGLWKTVNAGTTWEPIFDNEAVSTIGDMAIAPSDPSIIYVGTGESNNRQSSSWGNGMYKSLDSGKTWVHIGLEETEHIGRVVVHPANPNVAYVAAAGHLWGSNKERGVYKTTDGGKTWTLVLFINQDTGVNDIAMDPQSPDTLYAGAYQRRRTAFGFNGGGPDGAIYKTIDGGATWKKLAKGLPYEKGGDVGRIGLTVYLRNPNIVYALVEHKDGGIFRSEDKGETWNKMSSTNPRAMYYSQVIVDPNNDLRIWVLGAPVYYSEDGGKTFTQNRGQRIHGDYHAMWINPNDSNHMIAGTDGGIHWTDDGGRTWDFVNTIPLGQFYELAVDMQKPYRVCGGLQDNGSWCGPSSTLFTRGISNDEWENVGGGDGFYVQIDPTDPDILYSESQDGNVSRRNLKTSESKLIRPREKEGEPRFRFQWNSPIVISAHDPKTIYYGGNFLFKSVDRGDNWTKAGPDLTTGVDRNALPIMGRKPDRDVLSLNDGVNSYPCITTISESPRSPQVLWAGTDDGNLQVTRDGGSTWKNVAEKVPGVPKGTYVSRVEASHHAEGTAFVTFDGHRGNDFNTYVFMTTDYGETWKNIGAGLPKDRGTASVIREHYRNPNLLFVGTEYAAYASWDRGATWTKLKMNLPTVPVDDILIHPRDNDLIFGTHGRSIYILDDITPLEQLNDQTLNSDLYLFDIRPAVAWRLWNNKASTGAKFYIAPNAADGAMIHFYLKSKLADNERVGITILDKQGREVRQITCGGPAPGVQPPGGFGPFGGFGPARCEANPGINRAVWDLRQSSPVPPGQEPQQQFGFFGAARGPRVDPGDYTVKIAVVAASAGASRGGDNGGQASQQQGPKWESSKPVKVEEDPRVAISEADRAARREAIDRLLPLSAAGTQSMRTITGLRSSLTAAMDEWKRPGAARVPDNITKAAEAFLKKIDEIYPKFGTPPSGTEALGAAGPPLVQRPTPLPQRVNSLLNALDGWTAAPSAWQLEEISVLAKLVKEAQEQVRRLVDEDLAGLNKMMRDAGIPYITARTAGGPPGPPR
jgi:photosystem II stability/assembly factor-like uncharacterized protein